MSEPTLTDKQREALLATMPIGGSGWRQLRYPEQTFATVAAMLADERAAREAAEAKVRDLAAGIGALCEEADSIVALPTQDWWDRGWRSGHRKHAARLRALVDDPAAALAEVRAEAWNEGYGTALGDFDIAARAESRSPNPYRAEAEGAGR